MDTAPNLGHLLISLAAARHLAAKRVESPPFPRLIGAISQRFVMLYLDLKAGRGGSPRPAFPQRFHAVQNRFEQPGLVENGTDSRGN